MTETAEHTIASMINVNYDDITPDPSTDGSDAEEGEETIIIADMDEIMQEPEMSS